MHGGPGAPAPALDLPPPACSCARPGEAALVPAACLQQACGPGRSAWRPWPGSEKGGVAGCFDLLSTCGPRRRPWEAGVPGVARPPRSGRTRWSLRQRTHAGGGRRRLDLLFQGGAFGGRRPARSGRSGPGPVVLSVGWHDSLAASAGSWAFTSVTEQWRARGPEWPEASAVERPGRAEATAARGASRGRPTLSTRPLPSRGMALWERP